MPLKSCNEYSHLTNWSMYISVDCREIYLSFRLLYFQKFPTILWCLENCILDSAWKVFLGGESSKIFSLFCAPFHLSLPFLASYEILTFWPGVKIFIRLLTFRTELLLCCLKGMKAPIPCLSCIKIHSF